MEKKGPAVRDDLEKPQYTDLFFKLPLNINYKQNTMLGLCNSKTLQIRLHHLSFNKKEKYNTGWILFTYADVSLTLITILSSLIMLEL